MDAVTEITFEEIGIDLDGIAVGLFSGTANLDAEGAVTSFVLDGWKNGDRQETCLDVPLPYQHAVSFEAKLAIALAGSVETVRQPAIKDALDDWRMGLGRRGSGDPGPSQEQRL